jgi:hypothetical protein
LTRFFFLLLAVSLSISNAGDSAVDIKVCETHVGPLTGKTKFDQKVIQGLFPNYLVKKDLKLMGFYSRPALEVLHDGEVMLIISPDTSERLIGDVEILSGRIRNEFGPRVGWTYERTFKDNSTPQCHAEMKHMDEITVCRESKSRHVYYVFSFIDVIGSNGLPQIEFMGSQKIEEIIWRP